MLKMAKGFRFGRSTKEKLAYEALAHAGNHAFNDRRKKKGNNRGLWNIRLNAALRPLGHTYSRFIDMLNKSRDEVAYNLIDVDTKPSEDTLAAMEALDGVIHVRLLDSEICS